MSDHLKPYQFKAGEPSANPSGRPHLTAEEKSMRDNFRKSFAMLGNRTPKEIKELANDDTQPLPIVLAAKAAEWAMKKGNPSMFREIYDRTVGKVVQHVELSGVDGAPLISDKIKSLAKNIVAEKTECLNTEKSTPSSED